MVTATTHPSGWLVGESASLEADQALGLVSGALPLPALPPDVAALYQAVPEDWRAQWPHFLGQPRWTLTLLEAAAAAAGVLLEPDYERATLAIRQLSPEKASAALLSALAPLDLESGASPQADPARALVDVAVAYYFAAYRAVGLDVSPEGELARRLRLDLALLPRLLLGGDVHAAFWHWLDRFHYESYCPWRAGRESGLAQSRQDALLALSAGERAGTPPDLTWLPPTNPLLRLPELGEAVRSGLLRVYFWVEPFGLSDSWSLHPRLVVVSFNEPGAFFERFRAAAADVAGRAAVLGDPTRLTILRLIRHFGMVNTEIAEYLGLARPTVSIHAKVLRDAGLIRSRQDGRVVRHEIVTAEVRRLFADLERFLDLPQGQPPDDNV